MQVLVIASQKGGVGKTSTAHTLGAGMSRKGMRVLFVDVDPQCNLSFVLGVDASGTVGRSSLDVLTGSCDAAAAVQHAPTGDVIAASAALSGADAVLTAVGKEYRLREALEPLRGLYDVVVVDTPPALGILTVNALTAADRCIIPAQPDALSLQGITQLYGTIGVIRRYCNPGLIVDGIVLTRFNGRSAIARDAAQAAEQAAQQMGTRVYRTRIRECVALREAQALRKSIFEHSPKSNAAADYTALLDEIGGNDNV